MSTVYQYQEDLRSEQDQSFKKKALLLLGLLGLLMVIVVLALLFSGGEASKKKELDSTAALFLTALNSQEYETVKQLAASNSPLQGYSEESFVQALKSEDLDYSTCRILNASTELIEEKSPSGTVVAECGERTLNISIVYEANNWKVYIIT